MCMFTSLHYVYLTLKVPEKLLLYGPYVYYVVHICDFGMLRVKYKVSSSQENWNLCRGGGADTAIYITTDGVYHFSSPLYIS